MVLQTIFLFSVQDEHEAACPQFPSLPNLSFFPIPSMLRMFRDSFAIIFRDANREGRWAFVLS